MSTKPKPMAMTWAEAESWATPSGVEQAAQDMGDGRLADRAQGERGQGDAELRGGEVSVEPRQ